MGNSELFSFENKSGAGDNFSVEELLNFTDTDTGYESLAGPTSAAAVNSSNSSISGGECLFSSDISRRSFADPTLSEDLCLPYDDIAELEWLSNFVDDSFSSQDIQNLNLISGTKTHSQTRTSDQTKTDPNTTESQQDHSIQVKTHIKRPRATSPRSPPSNDHPAPKKKREMVAVADGRRCLHCASDKTPQWRTGPMGPKTLCNACGVRYKSGRLVPEYRPAASPTFVTAEHSNSHRKVMELRRQKETQKRAHHQRFDMGGRMGVLDGSVGGDYLIHRHIMPDFQHLI